ncbi:MAG: WYL domain-containing protein [Acidimicrobiales bacterium]
MGSSANPDREGPPTLALLQQHPGITAAEIADRLDCRPRRAAVRRTAARGRHPDQLDEGSARRYRIGRSLRPMPLIFTAGESLGLVMAVLDGHHAATDADDPVGSALANSSDPCRLTARHAAMVRDHARAAPDRRALARPCHRERPGRDGCQPSRSRSTTSPDRARPPSFGSTRGQSWSRHGRWYLLCLARDTEAARALRIDRIRRLDPLNVDVEPPVDLNPVEWLENHLATGWNHEVIIDFDAPPPRSPRGFSDQWDDWRQSTLPVPVARHHQPGDVCGRMAGRCPCVPCGRRT